MKITGFNVMFALVVLFVITVFIMMIYSAIKHPCVRYTPAICYMKTGNVLVPYECPMCVETK